MVDMVSGFRAFSKISVDGDSEIVLLILLQYDWIAYLKGIPSAFPTIEE